jgi:WD40 repeat protein
VVWSADQHHAISCSRDIRLWDVERVACVRVFDGHRETIRMVQWSTDQKRVFGVVAAVFSQDQRRAFSCDCKGGIGVWDLEARTS